MGFTSTITKSLNAQGVGLVSSVINITSGVLVSVSETFSQSAPNTATSWTAAFGIGESAGSGSTNIQYLYMNSTAVDCICLFYTAASSGYGSGDLHGTGTLEAKIGCSAGQAFEWDSATGLALPASSIGITPWTAPVFAVIIQLQGTVGAIWNAAGGTFSGGTPTTVATASTVTIAAGMTN